MAVSLTQRAQVAVHNTFQNRCLMARVIVAVDMLTNPDAHAQNTLAYARTVLMSPLDYPERVSAVVVTNDVIATAEVTTPGSSEDADIISTIETAWPYLA